MKTITFEGKQYEVEDWVNWVCKTKTGIIDFTNNEPSFSPIFNGWLHRLSTKFDKIEHTNPDNWQDSLTKV
jgi:hypothetical protein